MVTYKWAICSPGESSLHWRLHHRIYLKSTLLWCVYSGASMSSWLPARMVISLRRWPSARWLEAHHGMAWEELIFPSASAGWIHAWVSQKCFHTQFSLSTRLVGHRGTDRSSPKLRLVIVSLLEREARRWPYLQKGGEGRSQFPEQPIWEGSSWAGVRKGGISMTYMELIRGTFSLVFPFESLLSVGQFMSVICTSLSRKWDILGCNALFSFFIYRSVWITHSFEATSEVQARNWQMRSQLPVALCHLQTPWLPTHVCSEWNEDWGSLGKATCSTSSGLCFPFVLKFGVGKGHERHAGQFSYTCSSQVPRSQASLHPDSGLLKGPIVRTMWLMG